jgi:hypothetical protein
MKFKVSMLGAYAVGKTSLVRRFVLGGFDEKYHVTIGVKMDKKTVTVAGRACDLTIWDVAGAEEKFTVPSHYIKGSAGYLLVIDGTRADTLDRGLDLVKQIDTEVGPLPKVVLLNKSDLTDRWQLDDPALQKLVPLGCPVMRTSAKSGEHVDEAFQLLAEQIVETA